MRRARAKELFFSGPALRWPFQILVYAAVYFISSGITQILFGNNLLPLLGGRSGDAGLLQQFYNLEDILSNLLITLALLGAFRLVSGMGTAGMGLTRLNGRTLKDAAAGLALGAAGMSAVVLAQTAVGAIELAGARPDAGLAGFFLLFVSVGLEEETLTRGVLQSTLARCLHPAAAILAPSLFFGLIHIRNAELSALAMANIVLAGIALALLTWRTGGLYAAIGFHTAWNFAQGNLFGLPVSGNHMSQSTCWTARTGAGAAWLTGGGFGPEGTVFCTAFYLLLSAALLFWPRTVRRERRDESRRTE